MAVALVRCRQLRRPPNLQVTNCLLLKSEKQVETFAKKMYATLLVFIFLFGKYTRSIYV